MLSVDSNILLRYIVKDNQQQAESARRFLDGLTPRQPGFICREVIQEFVWVLARTHNFPRARIATIILTLTAGDTIVIEAKEDVISAAIQYRQSSDDFSDLLILAAAKRVGAKPLYTFDRKSLPGWMGAALLSVP